MRRSNLDLGDIEGLLGFPGHRSLALDHLALGGLELGPKGLRKSGSGG